MLLFGGEDYPAIFTQTFSEIPNILMILENNGLLLARE
jgi:hypothetical protein